MNRNAWIALTTVVVLCLLGLILGIYFGIKSARLAEDAKSNTLFHEPFNASLDIATIHEELGTEKNYFKVEWNPTAQKMNFEQTAVFSSNYDFDYELSYIMADNKATVSISHMNSSQAFCVEQMFPSQWVSVFQHILTADNWRIGEESSRCRGDIWYTKYLSDAAVEICNYDNRLEYVTYQTKRATVTSWTRTEEQNIQIRPDVLNGPCSNISKIACNVTNIPPKVKRDSGLSPTTCLFVHGAGENAAGNDVIEDFPKYWGNMQTYTSNCVSHKFLVYNSRDNGWDKDQIHQHFCDVAATNGTISNTVIFTHSLGNMVVAAALHQQKCTFNQATSRWFSVQGPWTGSKVANTLSNICRNPTLPERLIRRILRRLGYCKHNENIEFDVYTTLKTDYISPTGILHDDLIQMGRRFVSGVMCGTSSWGLARDYTESAALKIMQWYSDLENPNDGMVAFDSCKLKDEVFEERSSHPHFKGKFNHADGTCRHGGCPCKWYEYMH